MGGARLAALVVSAACCLSGIPPVPCSAHTPEQAGAGAYLGRFLLAADRPETLLYIELRGGRLVARPILWTSRLTLKATGPDAFVSVRRESRTFCFRRGDDGTVDAVEVHGLDDDGVYRRLRSPHPLPLERLLAGDVPGAVDGFRHRGLDAERMSHLSNRVLHFLPSTAEDVAEFQRILLDREPEIAVAWTVRGYALARAGHPDEARSCLLSAERIAPGDRTVALGLELLAARDAPAAGGWQVPFGLDELFRPPSSAEIRQVETRWEDLRDLGVHEVESLDRRKWHLGHSDGEVRLIAHRLRGARHHGAVVVPEGSSEGSCPVILVVRGVSWDYEPYDLARMRHDILALLGEEQRRFVFAVPGLPGEVLRFEGKDYRSGGDRTDAWNGATDAALAFLSVTLATTPEADGDRIAVFGRSRGGTVALLAAARDARIDGAAAWVAPIDWFAIQGAGGWTPRQVVPHALGRRAAPHELGGQWVEHFLRAAVEGTMSLEETRLRMLASSPLYFIHRLPRFQAHYGEDDFSVPIENGRALRAALSARPERGAVLFHPRAGHDLDREIAFPETRDFLLEVLGNGRR